MLLGLLSQARYGSGADCSAGHGCCGRPDRRQPREPEKGVKAVFAYVDQGP